MRLLSGSPLRTQPFCPVFGACGGCQVQHLAYAAQLTWKADLVRNALSRIGGFTDVTVRPTVGMPNPRNYRNKMSLVVDRSQPVPAIGFYQQRSHDVVPIDACPIVLPKLSEYVGRLNNARIANATAPIFEDARHIVARASRSMGTAVVTVTTQRASAAVERGAAALQAQLPGSVGVSNSFEPSSENAILGRKHEVVSGVSEIEERIAGVRYRVSSQSFFQVNVDIVARIFDFMKSALGRPRRIVDLYCGAGMFALYFAKHGSEVYGIEENPAAIDEAHENARLNGLTANVLFRTGRVEDVVRQNEAKEAMKNADIVFLDPPRKGSDETTLTAVADAQVPFVWYLSCDPATLARDLKFLASKGYQIGVVQPFDMFPQTGHVETLVTLYREADARRHMVQEAFLNAPTPAWPADDEFAHDSREYPDFVIRED